MSIAKLLSAALSSRNSCHLGCAIWCPLQALAPPAEEYLIPEEAFRKTVLHPLFLSQQGRIADSVRHSGVAMPWLLVGL